MKYKNKICLYTLCYNELPILPFAIEYWRRFVDKVVLYDNGSTDGSVQFLQDHHSDFVEVRSFTYKDNNKIDDYELKWYKNNWWKEARGKYDYVIMCDLDEFFYTFDVEEFMEYIIDNNITIVKSIGYDLVTPLFPTYNPGELLHEKLFFGSRFTDEDKCIFFNCNEIEEINYDFGCHTCEPSGNVKYYDKSDFYIFHAKYLSLDYIIDKYNRCSKKLSDVNNEKNFGNQYNYDVKKIENIFYEKLNSCEYISTLFEGYRKNNYLDYLNLYINVDILNPSYNNDCVIMVPIYKEELTIYEKISLKQLHHYLGDKYDICFVCPEYFNLKNYYNIINNFKVIYCSPDYFLNIFTYNSLCLNKDLYTNFNNYKYVLFYQLDAIIFSDELDKFIKFGYDYYGAPHLAPDWKCGNGGLSLRNVEKMINFLSNVEINNYIYEDIFICNYNNGLLNIAPYHLALEFAISVDKENKLNELGHLPFGTHYFKWDNFWDKNIIVI